MLPIKPIITAGFIAVCTLSTQADIITMVHEGNGTGTIGQLSFNNADFTITTTGDNDDIIGFGFGVLFIEHTMATIDIAGLGSFDFITQTRTFVNNSVDTVGFSRSDPFLDLFNGPTNAAFATWDMTTSIGPITGSGDMLQWDLFDIETTGGILFFDSRPSDARFTATVVPTPAALSLLTITALASTRRRR